MPAHELVVIAESSIERRPGFLELENGFDQLLLLLRG
jgi:hypothetical protein